jgi:hypothetical protein
MPYSSCAFERLATTTLFTAFPPGTWRISKPLGMNFLGSIGMFAIGMEAAADEEEWAVIEAILSVDCTVGNEDEETEFIFAPKKD